MDDFVASVITGLISGGLVTAILGFLLQRRTARIEGQIKDQYDKSLSLFQSTLSWKVQSVSELLGPMYIQLDRTKRAFNRWEKKNIYLEAKVIREGNLAIRDLLLSKGHLIPPELLEDAGLLIEHYDRRLEQYDRLRGGEEPDLNAAFVFVGPEGYPFPVESEKRFLNVFHQHVDSAVREGEGLGGRLDGVVAKQWQNPGLRLGMVVIVTIRWRLGIYAPRRSRAEITTSQWTNG